MRIIHRRTIGSHSGVFLALCAALPGHWCSGAPPRTIAESSDFKRTSTYSDVLAFIEDLTAASDLVRRTEMGRTVEDRAIPLLIVADPPVESPREARESERLVVFLQGNIHAGEVCGKEALLMLARDLTLGDDPRASEMLREIIFLIAPIYNADGNERMAPGNRPGQVGPEQMGVRTNAQGLDLNRDHMKLDSPEARAHVRLLNEWSPHLTIDTHTTNGSHHRFTLTYAAPQDPAGHPAPIEFLRDDLLPEASRRLEARTGYRTFFYGNFDRDYTAWRTYSSLPRFGTPYRGLRNRMSILSEAHAYAPYKDRVLSTYEFVREVSLLCARRAGEIRSLLERAERETIEAARAAPDRRDRVGIRHRIAAFPDLVRIPGYVMTTDNDGGRRPTDRHWTYIVRHMGRFEPTLTALRPRGYLIPEALAPVVEKLLAHGVVVDEAPIDATLEAERYRLSEVRRSEGWYQGHRLVEVEASARPVRVRPAPGDFVVWLDQPLGTLAMRLLEPESDDGLTRWGLMDAWLDDGGDFPVVRIIRATADGE